MDQQYSRDFPILSYILSKLDPESNPPLSPQLQETLLTQLPHLTHPKVLASMTHLIPTTLSQTLSLLRALGTPPDPSTVVVARAKIAEIQSKLQNSSSSALQETQNYSQVREAAEKELEIYKAVVRLEEIHETYEEQLRDVEVRLAEAYGSVVVDLEKEEGGEVIKLDEEVVRILKEAESGVAVERVELCGRHLRFLPEAFGKLHGLVSLNLSNNQLQSIPDSIAGLENLEELHVSSNLLVSLPDSLGLLLNLRILNVSGNKLDALPESIARCSSLVELDASFNNLMCLPTNIGYGLLNLERLSIHLNKIRSLPPSICEMRSLRYLDVHFNELRGLPHAIGRLTTLEVLNLSSNFSDLTELPESIGDLTNLRELDLSNNQIRALPAKFGLLRNLNKLNLDQNPLVIPPMEIVSQGVEAVKEYMAQRWLDIIAEEQQRSMLEASKQTAQTGWLGWGTSLLNNLVSRVSDGVAGNLGGKKDSRDACLDQQL
ncbi:unnamed protein product [Prunus armeniaca]|uniref:Plant intracellular Ras-group-related LRR protein 3 n=1 Tax=Prunus armeniaca TaxID=36596 RepID=A0A6J5TK69_PRUAR|nr:unnamed protein product [Prunus armeniaca]